MFFLRTLRYEFCKCSVILEHRYVYSKRILNDAIIAENKFKQKKCNQLDFLFFLFYHCYYFLFVCFLFCLFFVFFSVFYMLL